MLKYIVRKFHRIKASVKREFVVPLLLRFNLIVIVSKFENKFNLLLNFEISLKKHAKAQACKFISYFVSEMKITNFIFLWNFFWLLRKMSIGHKRSVKKHFLIICDIFLQLFSQTNICKRGAKVYGKERIFFFTVLIKKFWLLFNLNVKK